MDRARGLGRQGFFDPANLLYLISDVVPPADVDVARALTASRAPELLPHTLAPERPYTYFYDSAWWGDQGDAPACTAFALSHAMADGPVTHPKANPLDDPMALYRAIVQRDRAAGRWYTDGATSLAMAQEAQVRGWIGEYRWGYTLADFIAAIRIGPVLLGIDWYAGMDTPDAQGVIRANGAIRGGHEIVCNGVNLSTGLARLKNSWGRSWARDGHAYLPLEDVEALIADGGDCVMFRELAVARAVAA